MSQNAKTFPIYNNVILIPTDFSKTCANAISQGVKLAQTMNFRVCLLHVINNETKAYLKKRDAGDVHQSCTVGKC